MYPQPCPSFTGASLCGKTHRNAIASKNTDSRMVNTSSEAASGPMWVNAPNRSAEPMREKFGVVNFMSAREGTFRDQPVAASFTEPEGDNRLQNQGQRSGGKHAPQDRTLHVTDEQGDGEEQAEEEDEGGPAEQVTGPRRGSPERWSRQRRACGG